MELFFVILQILKLMCLNLKIIVKDDEISCGTNDYLEVGGSSDLETSELETKEDICDWPLKKVKF